MRCGWRYIRALKGHYKENGWGKDERPTRKTWDEGIAEVARKLAIMNWWRGQLTKMSECGN